MAVTWVNGSTINVASGQSGTISNYTPGAAGNLLHVFSRGGVTTDTFTVSDGSNTWLHATALHNDTGDGSNTHDTERVENCASATITITVDASANNVGHSLRSVFSEWSTGVSNFFQLSDTGKNTATTTSGTVTTSGTAANTGDLVAAGAGQGTNVTFAAGTGYTLEEVVPAAGTSRCADEWKTATAGGAQTATITWGGGSVLYDMHISVYAATGVSGGGGGPAAVLSERPKRGAG